MSQISIPSSISSVPGDVSTAFVTDNGIAIPVSSTINIVGDQGLETSGVGNTVTIIDNRNIVAIVSNTINFKTTGLSLLFTTPVSSRFAVIFTQNICDTATAVVQNSQYNIGWTPAQYDDYISGDTFGPFVANTENFQDPGSSPRPIFPANTNIMINMIQADGGTALTGRIVFYGVYI